MIYLKNMTRKTESGWGEHYDILLTIIIALCIFVLQRICKLEHNLEHILTRDSKSIIRKIKRQAKQNIPKLFLLTMVKIPSVQ